MRRLLPFLSLLIAPALFAQAYLVKDINVSAKANPSSSSPSNFIRYNSRVYFAAMELWSTDGTAAGTSRVADIFPGSAASNPNHFVILNGKLLFNATDNRGQELWMSDGTEAGTRIVADILPNASSSPGERIVFGQSMLFTAYDGIDGIELWITDGTPTGTKLFKDLEPGAPGSDPHSFVIYRNEVWFGAAHGLWKSDGTAAGTVLVSALDDARSLVVAGDRLFFTGRTRSTGAELWMSDGTASGTRMVADLGPGTNDGIVFSDTTTALGNRVLFRADDGQHGDELWISDGSVAGTHIVRDLNPGAGDGVYDFGRLAVMGNAVFFAGTTPATGFELWKTDGTETGTVLVHETVAGTEGRVPSRITVAGDRLFFQVEGTSFQPWQLWVSDGTSAGTRRLQSNELAGMGNEMTGIDGVLWFAGADRLHGFEPWRSDGTDAGTAMITNLAAEDPPSSAPHAFTAAGDWVYFEAWDGTGPYQFQTGASSIWRSDGTPEGTLKVVDTFSYSYQAVGRNLFFTPAGASPLWMSAGTPESTAEATSFTSKFPSIPSIQKVVGDTLFVNAGGTLYAMKASLTGPAISLGTPFAAVYDVAGKALVFANNDLWVSDGTPQGTFVIAQNPRPQLLVPPASVGGRLFFFSSDGPSLRTSDGTNQGTVFLKSVSANIGQLTPAGHNLFFVLDNNLWVSDGTESGTRALPAASPGTIAATGGRVVFSKFDAATGFELWVSDGTDAGTHLLRDINPGTPNSSITELASIAGLVYFTAFEPAAGSEAWVTDGTSEGTRLAADVIPGPGGATPRQYVRAGERVFMSAATVETGNELWAMPLPSVPRIVMSHVRVSEAASAARFTLTLSSASTKTVTAGFATLDASAVAGSDYDAASGTITFAPGETSKTIDVRLRNDTDSENDEMLWLTLSNPANAALETTSAAAIIEDDDALADLGLSVQAVNFGTGVVATNRGPRAATRVQVTSTSTYRAAGCNGCSALALLPADGQPRSLSWETPPADVQVYRSATITASERDPQTANNSIAWTQRDNVVMDALYLTPGAQAAIAYSSFGASGTHTLESSNPSIVSVPATVAFTANQPATFIARGLAAGSATIRILSGTTVRGTLTVDVVASGSKPRWPGGLASEVSTFVPIDLPVLATIRATATAPFTGETPTGTVTVTSNGRELARTVITTPGTYVLPLSFTDLGKFPLRIDYSGDANFHPWTTTTDTTVTPGRVTLSATAVRIDASVELSARVVGSPLVKPTGTIRVSENGVKVTDASLVDGEARITIPNVSASAHTYRVEYFGDARYNGAITTVLASKPKARAVR